MVLVWNVKPEGELSLLSERYIFDEIGKGVLLLKPMGLIYLRPNL